VDGRVHGRVDGDETGAGSSRGGGNVSASSVLRTPRMDGGTSRMNEVRLFVPDAALAWILPTSSAMSSARCERRRDEERSRYGDVRCVEQGMKRTASSPTCRESRESNSTSRGEMDLVCSSVVSGLATQLVRKRTDFSSNSSCNEPRELNPTSQRSAVNLRHGLVPVLGLYDMGTSKLIG
jgi:hypothetical protein